MPAYYVDIVGGNDTTGTGSSGNAWATIGYALAHIAGGDTVWAKASGVYSIAADLVCSVGTYNKVTAIIGYTTTPGDGGRATIRATAAVIGFTASADNVRLANFVLDGNGTGTVGFKSSLYNGTCVNCLIQGWTSSGATFVGANGSLRHCTVTGCGGTGAVYANGQAANVVGCTVSSNNATGIYYGDASAGMVSGNTVVNNNGAGTYDGIVVDNTYGGCVVDGNTVDNNGRHGISTPNYYRLSAITNNILTRNGGYGIHAPALQAGTVDPACDYNWFGSGSLANTSGARNGVTAGPHDLGGDPGYANSGSGDYTPTNSAVQAGL